MRHRSLGKLAQVRLNRALNRFRGGILEGSPGLEIASPAPLGPCCCCFSFGCSEVGGPGVSGPGQLGATCCPGLGAIPEPLKHVRVWGGLGWASRELEARDQLWQTPLPSCSSGTGLFSAPHNVLRLQGNSEGTITEPVASLEVGGGLRTLRAVLWSRFPEQPEFLSNSLGALKFPRHRGLIRTKYCSHYTKVVKALASGPQRPCVFPGTGGGQAPLPFLPHLVSWTSSCL